ncbi:zinc finger protein 36 family 3 protein [Cyclospora cayetanensis]|uniref:Zinc finger protein 36 family 3 protein n=1 Tax=Cyclospora cayetanensis TaxID=88456 RepID=A0A1D3CZX4_9EIME|nr:zinc finger protein 36 family 3 protein [Cyclospora cayetanensis]
MSSTVTSSKPFDQGASQQRGTLVQGERAGPLLVKPAATSHALTSQGNGLCQAAIDTEQQNDCRAPPCASSGTTRRESDEVAATFASSEASFMRSLSGNAPPKTEAPRGTPGVSLEKHYSKSLLSAAGFRTFVLCYLSYAALYFTRKPFSVVKEELRLEFGVSAFVLGCIDTAFLGCYATGQLLLPLCLAGSSRALQRWLILASFFGSFATVFAFSFCSGPQGFAVFWGLNGLLQAPAFPVFVELLSHRVSTASRGRVLGSWTTSQQLGGMVATLFCSLVDWIGGWRSVFCCSALLCLVGGLVLRLILPTVMQETFPQDFQEVEILPLTQSLGGCTEEGGAIKEGTLESPCPGCALNNLAVRGSVDAGASHLSTDTTGEGHRGNERSSAEAEERLQEGPGGTLSTALKPQRITLRTESPEGLRADCSLFSREDDEAREGSDSNWETQTHLEDETWSERGGGSCSQAPGWSKMQLPARGVPLPAACSTKKGVEEASVAASCTENALLQCPQQGGGRTLGGSRLSRSPPVGCAPPPFRLTGMIALCALGFFCVKFVRCSLAFWLQYFLCREGAMPVAAAGFGSVLFDVGGAVGAVGAGLLADKLLKGRRLTLAALLCVGTSSCLFLVACSSRQLQRLRLARESLALERQVSLLLLRKELQEDWTRLQETESLRNAEEALPRHSSSGSALSTPGGGGLPAEDGAALFIGLRDSQTFFEEPRGGLEEENAGEKERSAASEQRLPPPRRAKEAPRQLLLFLSRPKENPSSPSEEDSTAATTPRAVARPSRGGLPFGGEITLTQEGEAGRPRAPALGTSMPRIASPWLAAGALLAWARPIDRLHQTGGEGLKEYHEQEGPTASPHELMGPPSGPLASAYNPRKLEAVESAVRGASSEAVDTASPAVPTFTPEMEAGIRNVQRQHEERVSMLLQDAELKSHNLQQERNHQLLLLLSCLVLVGLFGAGPDSVLGASAALDLLELPGAPQNSPAAVSAFINAVGALGALSQGICTAAVSELYGWDVLFGLLSVLCLCTGALLLPAALREKSFSGLVPVLRNGLAIGFDSPASSTLKDEAIALHLEEKNSLPRSFNAWKTPPFHVA